MSLSRISIASGSASWLFSMCTLPSIRLCVTPSQHEVRPVTVTLPPTWLPSPMTLKTGESNRTKTPLGSQLNPPPPPVSTTFPPTSDPWRTTPSGCVAIRFPPTWKLGGGGGPDSSPSSVGPPTKVAPLPTWRLPVAVKSSAKRTEPDKRITFPTTVVGPPVTQAPLTTTFVEYVPESTPGLSKLPEQVYGAAADAPPASMSIVAARAPRLTSHSRKHRFIDPSFSPRSEVDYERDGGTLPPRRRNSRARPAVRPARPAPAPTGPHPPRETSRAVSPPRASPDA